MFERTPLLPSRSTFPGSDRTPFLPSRSTFTGFLPPPSLTLRSSFAGFDRLPYTRHVSRVRPHTIPSVTLEISLLLPHPIPSLTFVMFRGLARLPSPSPDTTPALCFMFRRFDRLLFHPSRSILPGFDASLAPHSLLPKYGSIKQMFAHIQCILGALCRFSCCFTLEIPFCYLSCLLVTCDVQFTRLPMTPLLASYECQSSRENCCYCTSF